MRERVVVPVASTLLESLRALGYSFETAVADLIDNSVTAGAKSVAIQWRASDEPYVAIIDDGHGMSAETLCEAMRHGSRNPLAGREELDLGRFGLGMKTASLSQARQLTVISLAPSGLSAFRWDLDIIEKKADWVLCELDDSEIRDCPHVDSLLRQGHGTMVLWQKLDRVQAGEYSIEKALSERMGRTREHLALVFHRYLSGEKGFDRLTFSINGANVEPLDPFLNMLGSNRGRQVIQPETMRVEGTPVQVAPFVLPHISKLRPGEIRMAGGEEGLRRHQGFYVYRNRRLIIWGTWFRLAKQEELTKLARVQVDIPNTLDHLWTLDIKKSVATPPEAVRDGLRRIVGRIAERSRKVYTFRGRRSDRGDVIMLWDRMLGRSNSIAYVVNRKHPLVDALRAALPEEHLMLLERCLQALELSFPKDALYADLAQEKNVLGPVADGDLEEYLGDLACRWLDTLGRRSAEADRLMESLPLVDPFDKYPQVTKRILEALANGQNSAS